MVATRRSTRLQTVSSSQLINVDAETVVSKYKDASDSEDDDESSDDNSDDEDYISSSKKARKPAATRKRPTSSAAFTRAKRARPSKPAANSAERDQIADNYKTLMENFVPTSFFTAMCSQDNNMSMSEYVHEWLDSYIESPNKAKQAFVNFVLNCSGSLVQVEEHDVANSDSANETVSEVQQLFHEQKFHEFYLLNSHTHKNQHKEYKYLYENFVEFMENLVKISYEKGLLCVVVDDGQTSNENEEAPSSIGMGPMILDLIIWLSSLSVSNFRCLRYTATLALYVFQTALVELVPTIDKESIQNLQNLIERENKKKRSNKQAIEQWNAQLKEEQEHKATVGDIISEIFKVSFVHRFRDIDETIRCFSIQYLSKWFKLWPEHFYQVTYLKYFGWLLADQSASVRNQSLTALVDLVKFSNSKNSISIENDCLRQFFERFENRVRQIAFFDFNFECRMNAVKVLTQIDLLDYLEPSDKLIISSLIFQVSPSDTTVGASNTKEIRFLSSVAKMFHESESSETSDGYFTLKKGGKKSKNAHYQEFKKVVKFLKFLVDSLTCHIAISKKLASYEDYNSGSVEIHFESFDEYSQELFQVAQLLSNDYKHLIPTFCKMLTFAGDFKQLYEIDDSENVILPDSVASTDFYFVILSGLCQGFVGNSKSSALTEELKEMVMPYLAPLVLELDYKTPVLQNVHTLKIVQLFNYENFEEKNLLEISNHLRKLFMELPFSNDAVEKSFQDLFHFYKIKIGSDTYDSLWMSTITELLSTAKMCFQQDFTEGSSFNENLKRVMQLFVNKLVVVGKFYEVDFDKDFTELFISKVFEPLIDEIDDLDSNFLDFRVFPLFISWSLIRLSKSIPTDNNGVATDDSDKSVAEFPREVFNQIYNFTEYLVNAQSRFFALVGNENLQQLLYKLSSTVMDVLISLKAFTLNCESEEWISVLENDYQVNFNTSELVDVLQNAFCYLECKAASVLQIRKLNRFDQEDVFYDQYLEAHMKPYEEHTHAVVDETMNELCIYTVKIKTLIKLNVVDASAKSTERLLERVLLNKAVLGVVFNNIVDDAMVTKEDKSKDAQPAAPSSRVQRQESITEFANDPIEEAESLGF